MSENSQGLALSRYSMEVYFLPTLFSGPQEEMTLRESDCEILGRGMFNTGISNYASLRMPFH